MKNAEFLKANLSSLFPTVDRMVSIVFKAARIAFPRRASKNAPHVANSGELKLTAEQMAEMFPANRMMVSEVFRPAVQFAG